MVQNKIIMYGLLNQNVYTYSFITFATWKKDCIRKNVMAMIPASLKWICLLNST